MRETWHEHYIRMLLPEDLRNCSTVSLSIRYFLGMIQGHLKTIYGERADWQRNLQKYYQSEEYRKQDITILSIGDIPELGLEEIHAWIDEEEQFTANIRRLLELLPLLERDGNPPETVLAAFREASSLLGLDGPHPGAIYHWIVDWENISEAELQQIKEKIATHFPEFSIAVRTLIKLCTNGRLVTYPVLETVMTQQKQKYFYRGENAYYGSCKPGAFRWADKSTPAWLVHRINALRRNEGCEFLDNIISTFAWSFGTTNHYAICQHYGLKTEMIDITSDIWAALFFACTKYEDGNWRPLRKDEIEHADSRKGLYMRGGDSRYGILYKRLAEPVELEWLFRSERDFWNIIVPIGYQPFMRCSYQHAYGLFENDMGYDLYQDKSFGKYKIRLNEELCHWVFEQTHHGKDVFPVDDIPDISAYMKKINETKRFSQGSFSDIIDGLKLSEKERKRVQFELFQYGYTIDQGKVSFITEEELGRINTAYPPGRAEMLTKMTPISDPLIIMTTDEQSQKDREADDYKYRFMIVTPPTKNAPEDQVREEANTSI